MCAQVSVQVRHPLGRGEPRTPGKETFQRGTLCVKARGLLGQASPPFPLFHLCSPLPKAQPSAWELAGSLSQDGLQPALAWAFPGAEGRAPPSRQPRDLIHTFLQLTLAGSPPEPLPRCREGCGVMTRAGWRQGPCSPGQAPGPLASARTSARPPGKTWAGTPGRCCCAPCRRPWWLLRSLQPPLGEEGRGARLRTVGPRGPPPV